ncbi:MAG: RNA-binding transcriptional accessory protein, partial [Planctomycetes bacterium]|nr:RNA-binding transcriptional accessory protein [Planctomycetota bacterium]
KGLAPLAELIAGREAPGDREALVRPFVGAERVVATAEEAIDAACDILAEEWADHLDHRQWMREQVRRGWLVSQVKRGKKEEAAKFETYFDYRELLGKVPSHRFLAMQRGAAEGFLKVGVEVDEERVMNVLTSRLVPNPRLLFFGRLKEAAADCYSRLLFPSVESAVLAELKEQADEEAIAVFAKNLRELLLAPPAGSRVVLGIDPGFRTGCKVAVVDATGKFLANAAIYPTPPHNKIDEAVRVLRELIARHKVELIAIGNGTGSRETDAFVADVLKSHGASVTRVLVNEAGASIYSASEIAREEYPDLDVTVRGAISIAHRLQDPLAELVKIDPKSIGVGQYQHDVNQSQLRKALEREVQSCVNQVGVDVNTASASLLSYVAGLGPKLAEAITRHRDEHGPFPSRQALRKVPRLGAKAFQQCAGFLRVRDGAEPLDNSAVHPESYYLVEKMAAMLNVKTSQLLANSQLLRGVDPQKLVDEKTGLPTVRDILAELEKPGRDPRKEFRVARFAEGVNELADLKPGMRLEGVVTNVTHFGAFVDIGVHQDGLVHVSELDRRFVEDPARVVAVGDIVQVKVLQVDLDRRRIALSRKQAMG